MKSLVTGLVATILIAGAAQPAQARTGDDIKAIQEEIEALKQGQEKIQAELAEIKKLLQQGARAAAGQQAFAPTDMQLGDVPYLGDKDARVTLVEFSDYQCPYCRRHATTVMPQLVESYVDSGKLKYVMREYPITKLHPRAVAASEAALCAGDQGQYWGMHDALFGDQKANTDENFKAQAANLRLDVAAFTGCMDDDRHMAQIKADQAEAQKLGITGTPSFVLGLTDPDDPGKVRLTKFIRGAQSLPAFAAAIDELLASEQAEE
jgi:protein-disulfide isomerase